MLSSLKLPHWLQIVVSALVVLTAWAMQQESSGSLVLPAAAVSALTVVSTLLGLFSPAAGAPSGPSAFSRGFSSVRALAVASVIGLAALVGCSWFSANKPVVVSDLGATAACVLTQVLSGDEDPLAVTAACAPATLADVVEIVESLLAFYTQPAADAGVDAAPHVSSANVALVGHLQALHLRAAQLQAAGKK
jgi:hypothetical protein